ncbi:hypothetical protein C0995_004063 [Termitomyces sp. Mi166|nr:hypothetical protein C0995_004063 [Termitomyces sp. Mi166\
MQAELTGNPAECNESSVEPVSSNTVLHSSTQKQPQLIKDAVYYMDTVVFKVKDHLFKVPTHFFNQKTSFFASHFASLDAGKKIDDGEKFIELEDVTPVEFRALLKFIHPIQSNSLRQVPPAPTTEEWITILKLSTQWTMLDVRRVAIDTLSSAQIPPVDRVVLAREYKVNAWLRSAYLELLKNASSMTQEDMDKIGLMAAFKVHKARERYMTASGSRSTLSSPFWGSNSETPERSFQFQETAVKRSAVERVPLAREQGVAECLREAFIELVKRSEPLTVDESRTLGFDTALRLYRVRERRIVRHNASSTDASKNAPVDEELKEELGVLVTYQPVERAVLARKYGIVEWLHQAFVDLMKRPEAISIAESKVLGQETAIRLAIARETYTINTNSHSGSRQNSQDGDENIGTFVDEELTSELSVVSSYSPVDRVLMARKAGVDEWIQSALKELVERKGMVTDDEAVSLGLETCIKLCRFRLENLENRGYYSSNRTDPGQIINDEFLVELARIRADERYIQTGIVLEEEGTQGALVGVATKTSKGKGKKRRY